MSAAKTSLYWIGGVLAFALVVDFEGFRDWTLDFITPRGILLKQAAKLDRTADKLMAEIDQLEAEALLIARDADPDTHRMLETLSQAQYTRDHAITTSERAARLRTHAHQPLKPW